MARVNETPVPEGAFDGWDKAEKEQAAKIDLMYDQYWQLRAMRREHFCCADSDNRECKIMIFESVRRADRLAEDNYDINRYRQAF